MDGIGDIWGYARAYRPMALSLPAVVGAAESTASGQARCCPSICQLFWLPLAGRALRAQNANSV